MVNLYIARHGQTEENVRRILQGQMPGHLTSEGIAQARTLRDRLRGTPFALILTSDLQRAVDTTRIIAEPHGGVFRQEPLLRERDFGIHTGGPYLRISSQLDPTAETIEQVARRAGEFLEKARLEGERLCREAEESTAGTGDVNILAVSHGLFLRVLQAVYHGVDTHDIEKMENAEVRILPLSGKRTSASGTMRETGGTAS